MIKLKGQIKLKKMEKSEQAEVRSGEGCSYSGGGLSFNCSSYHVHIHTSTTAAAVDTLHIHH